MKQLLPIFLCMSILASQASIAGATDIQDPVVRDAIRYVQTERLSERVMLAYWVGTGRSNLIAIKSQKGLMIIDTEMSPRIMQPIKRRIEHEFERDDWVYVINTHGHMHHAGGNHAFPNATIVGHENLAQDMRWMREDQSDPQRYRKQIKLASTTLEHLRNTLLHVNNDREAKRKIEGEIEFWELYSQDMKIGYPIVDPSLTFTDRHTLDLGDLTLELVFFGKGGHTLSDILIYVPEEKLLVTGAIIYQRYRLPWIFKEAQVQDIERFISVLDSFLDPEVQIKHLVPTHSPPLVKDDMIPVRNYYQTLLTGIRDAQAQGLSLEMVLEQFSQPKMFSYFYEPGPGEWEHGTHDRNIKNLWHILKQEA